MRKYRLALSPSISFDVDADWFAKGSRLQSLARILSFVGILSLLAMVATAPFLFAIIKDAETMYLYHLLAGAAFLIMLTTHLVIIRGWKQLIDPPAFVTTLFFSLVVITTYLLVSPYLGNTFGLKDIRYLGGVAVMGFLGLYYFTVMFVENKRRFEWLKNSFLLGLGIAALVSALDGRNTFALITVMALSVPLLFLYSITSRSKYFPLVSLLIFVLSVISTFRNPNLVWSRFVIAFVLVVLILLWLAAQNWQIDNPLRELQENWKQLRKGKKNISQFIADSGFTWLLILFVIWMLMQMVYIVSNYTHLAGLFNTFISGISSAFTAISSDPKSLFLGRGATGVIGNSTLETILRFQGLIGFGAYVMLFVLSLSFILRRAVEQIMSNFRSGYMAFTLFPLMLTVPILGAFTKLSIVEVMLWWIGLGIIAAEKYVTTRDVNFPTVKWNLRNNFLNKYSFVIKAVLMAAVIVAWVVLTSAIWGQIVLGKVS